MSDGIADPVRLRDLLGYQRAEAMRVLPADVASYYASGTDDPVAVQEAEAAWTRYRLLPRVLRDVSTTSTAVSLLGTSLPHPVLVAPTAFHGWAHPEAEVATARGAASAGATLVVSSRAQAPLEQIAQAAGTWWLQVYVTRDRSVTEGFVRRAAAAGAGALVLTGDTPYVGRRPASARVPALDDPAGQANLGRHLPAGADPRGALEQDPTVGLDAIGWLAGLSGLPVLVKGVLRADDTEACLAAGAAGVVVSNHGGRQADRAVPSAVALPEVVRAAAGMPVLVDGGVRTGADAAVALALGARAVLIGRPVLWALAADGAAGVATLLAAMRDDLDFVLRLLGVAGAGELDASFVRAVS